MYVHQSGVNYTLYIQNNDYANQSLNVRNAFVSEKDTSGLMDNKGLHDYLQKITDSIPELKNAEEAGIGIEVVILPESTSSTLKDAVNQTTSKMLDEGTDQNILKGVLGIVKANYSLDVENNPSGISTIKNLTVNYDLESLNNVLSKFQAIYSSNGDLSSGLGKFSQYLNEIYTTLKDEVNNPTISKFTENATTDNNPSSTKNDLVDTFIQEMDKSKDEATTGSEELNKKLYKNYIKSLTSSLTGGLIQQHS